MAIYGYCRCSTDEGRQDIMRQERELEQLGVKPENIFMEYASGIKRNRVELNRLLNIIKHKDTLISTELSRITRSTKDLCEIVELAKEKKLKLVLGTFKVDFSLDTIDPMVEGMLKMMGVFAELERNMISERVKSGIKNAKAKGTVIGRPPVQVDDIPDLFIRGYNLYKEKKIKKSELARLVRMSRTTVDKYINMLDSKE